MKHLLIAIFPLTLILWTGECLSKELKYEELGLLVSQSNSKAVALGLKAKSAELRMGHLSRSFVPDLSLTVGQESYESDPLGSADTQFYGVAAKVNIFNGMSDYWEEQAREASYELQLVENSQVLNRLILSAQKSYLEIAKMKSLLKILHDGISQLQKVGGKVARKAAAGLIARSDVSSINLSRVGAEEKIRQLERKLLEESIRLSGLLGMDALNPNIIDESLMDESLEVSKKLEAMSALDVRQYEARTQVNKALAKSQVGRQLPSVDLFAQWAQVPFSTREYIDKTDREEWRAGINATWKIGEFLEASRKAESLKAESAYLAKIGEYSKQQFDQNLSVIKIQLSSLSESIEEISKEINLSKDYYESLAAEYLRGVKSTSDLTTAFDQLYSLKQKRLELIVEFHLAKAKLSEQIMGEL